MLSKDFKEFIALLNAHNVRYLLVGAYAVALHGYPRYTKDLDVWVELSAANADSLLRALEEFGFGSLGLKSEDFLESDQVIQLGYPPNRIDIVTALTDVQFDDCYAARIEVDIQGLKINLIDLEHLKQNKRATGRPQDLADAEHLE